MSFQVRQQVTSMAGKQLEPSDLAAQSIDISPRQTRAATTAAIFAVRCPASPSALCVIALWAGG